MSHTAQSPVGTEHHNSRIEQMLNATKRLPANLAQLFDALYVQGLAEERVCAELRLSPEALNADKASMFKALKAAAS